MIFQVQCTCILFTLLWMLWDDDPQTDDPTRVISSQI